MDVKDAARVIRTGGIVAFPTETVYGLGADALDGDAVRKIYAAKGRPADNPCIVHVSDERMLRPLVRNIPPPARALIRRFWPGPLTILFPRAANVPDAVTAGLPTVAVRMPAHPLALALIRAARTPIAAPSANRSGRPSPTTAAHVRADFPRIPIVDGGPCAHGLESTVVDLSGRPRILRLGAITLEELKAAVPGIRVAKHTAKKPASPGMKYRHYSPNKPLLLFKDVKRMEAYARTHPRAVALCLDRHASRFRNPVLLGKNPEEMARNLYDALRTRRGNELLVHAVPKRGHGRAVMDRLERAAITRT